MLDWLMEKLSKNEKVKELQEKATEKASEKSEGLFEKAIDFLDEL